jgi:hypothetical protein
MRQLVKREAALAGLKERGIKVKKEKKAGRSFDGWAKHQAAEKKRRAKCKLLHAVAAVATPAILKQLVKADGTMVPAAWALLAREAYEVTSIDWHATVAKRMGLTTVQTDCRQQLEKWLKAKHTASELAVFAVELLLCGRPYFSGSYEPNPKLSATYVEACALAGVKLAKLEKAARAKENLTQRRKGAKGAKKGR